MAQADIETAAIYEALRDDLISLLLEHRSRGRFTRAADDTDQARSLFLIELTRSIADILVTAYPPKNSRAYAAALADAGTIASSIKVAAPCKRRHVTRAEVVAGDNLS
jgi:hypothetical protein